MQHEPLRQPLLAENAGDVLASIRRLIAQDDTGRPLPGRPRVDHPFHRPPRPPSGAEETPLVLGLADLVAGDTARPAQTATLPAAVDWQPSIITDWPHARIQAAPAQPATLAPVPQPAPLPQGASAIRPALVDAAARLPGPLPTAPEAETEAGWSDLTPEEQAEFAEAEAVLARMTASARPPSLSPAQTAEIVEFPLAESAQDIAPLSPAHAEASVLASNLFAQTATAETGEDLRQSIRDMIRQELEGGMGDRFSHNLHLLIRTEVEAVVRSLCAKD